MNKTWYTADFDQKTARVESRFVLNILRFFFSAPKQKVATVLWREKLQQTFPTSLMPHQLIPNMKNNR